MLIRGLLILLLAILGAGLLNIGLSEGVAPAVDTPPAIDESPDAGADIADAEDVLTHNIEAFMARDLDGVMADYADGAILITPDGSNVGKEAIRSVIAEAFTYGDQSEAPLTVTNVHSVGSLAYIMWDWAMPDGSVMQGSNTYVIEGGKITQESVSVFNTPQAEEADAEEGEGEAAGEDA